MTHDYTFRTGYSGAYEPGRVATIGGRIAVAWPGGVLFERLTGFGVALVISLLAAVFGMIMLRTVRGADRFAAADAQILDVDLLCRKMVPGGAFWTFTYDFGGRRVHGAALVRRDPILTDGVVTRGAAILEPCGSAQLLTVGSAQLPEAVEAAIRAAFRAHRAPLASGFADLVAATPIGPERDYVLAFGRAWHDPDVAKVNAAILQRHEAALALPASRVDALLHGMPAVHCLGLRGDRAGHAGRELGICGAPPSHWIGGGGGDSIPMSMNGSHIANRIEPPDRDGPGHAIDARSFGSLEAEVRQLHQEMAVLRGSLSELTRSFHERRGGWRVVAFLFPVVSALCAAATLMLRLHR